VRTLLVTAFVLLACGVAGGCADRSSRPSGADAPPSIPGGPDPIVLRVSRDGVAEGFTGAFAAGANATRAFKASILVTPVHNLNLTHHFLSAGRSWQDSGFGGDKQTCQSGGGFVRCVERAQGHGVHAKTSQELHQRGQVQRAGLTV
jgi:hypothetical protein